jgi:hypothetical protein
MPRLANFIIIPNLSFSQHLIIEYTNYLIVPNVESKLNKNYIIILFEFWIGFIRIFFFLFKYFLFR